MLMYDQEIKKDIGQIDALVVKVVERCNLNCSYCYMYNHADRSYLRRPAFMSDEVLEQLLRRIIEYCDRRQKHRMALVLHGGEPMLMGTNRFEKLAATVQQKLGNRLESLQMQSNATLVDDDWIAALRKFSVMVSVSLDGPRHIHDMFRVDHSGTGSHERALKGLLRLQDAGLLSGALCVVNPAHAGLGIYRYFRSLGIKRMNFLLPDASHDAKKLLYDQYGETPVADYLIPLFDDWYSEDDPDVSVRFFEDIIRAVLGGKVQSDAISNGRANYLVIDTDGTIQALDALKVCHEGLPESGLNVSDHGFDDLDKGLPLLYRIVNESIPLCSTCQQCPERETCGGGYLPHRYSRDKGFDNPSIWCKDLQKLFTHIRSHMYVGASA
jgi:uncharacterized protein